MANIRRNRPRTQKWPSLPQCQAPMVDSQLWSPIYMKRRTERLARAGWDPHKCTRGGSVCIDGKDYCGAHAGMLALAILMGEEVDWGQPWDKEPRSE